MNSRTLLTLSTTGYLAVIIGTVAVTTLCFVLYKAIAAPPRNDIDPRRFADERHHLEPDREMGWRLRRSHSVLVPGYGTPIPTMSHTDDRGARVGATGQKASHPVDVIIVGGSQTYGAASAYEQTIPAFLEQALDGRVANYSVPAFGGTGSIIALKRNLDQRPSWVAYGFWEDHLRRNVIPCAPVVADVCLEYPSVRFRDDGNAYIEPPSNPFKAMLTSRRWYRETTTQDGSTGNFFTDVYWTGYRLFVKITRSFFASNTVEAYNDPAFQWRAARYVLDRMNADTTHVGAKLIVVWIPYYFSEKMNSFPGDVAADICAKGVHLIDGTRVINALRSRGLDVSVAGDGHISPAAHRMFAERIAHIIKGNASDCPDPMG
jgi:hypothetical protein